MKNRGKIGEAVIRSQPQRTRS